MDDLNLPGRLPSFSGVVRAQNAIGETVVRGRRRARSRWVPAGRVGDPREVENLTLYFVSPVTDDITGHIAVDGGRRVSG
jgi:hypothetical protein